MLSPNHDLLRVTRATMTSLLTTLLLTSMMMMMGKSEPTEKPPPPPEAKTGPTWRPAEGGGRTTLASDAEGQGGNLFSGWPWWWWIAAAGVGAVLVILNIMLCVWCCWRRHRRRAAQNAEEADMEIHAPPTDFRRMESSAAKRYLHNIASVFSWGSDFDGEPPGQRGTVVYANTQNLGISRAAAAEPSGRKSGQHYHNLL